MKHLGKFTAALAMAGTLVFFSVWVVPAAVQGVMGLAVARAANKYSDVKDYSVGDAITSGVLMAGCMLWNGASADRCPGSILFGLQVDVTRLPSSGAAFYSVARDNITTASVNLAFGFTSKKVLVIANPGNTAVICLDWLGGTAVCPAANTAGDATLTPGTSILLDEYAGTSLSVIAASGTQGVNIQAWN